MTTEVKYPMTEDAWLSIVDQLVSIDEKTIEHFAALASERYARRFAESADFSKIVGETASSEYRQELMRELYENAPYKSNGVIKFTYVI